jgi:hypothetical protein
MVRALNTKKLLCRTSVLVFLSSILAVITYLRLNTEPVLAGFQSSTAKPGASYQLSSVVASSSWLTSPVDSNVSFVSMKLDHQGSPRIAYSTYDDTNGYLVNYAYRTGDLWTVTTIANGYYPSLALTSAGEPRISFYDTQDLILKYAEWTGTYWNIQTVDNVVYAGVYTSLALDPVTGQPHISYGRRNTSELKYATLTAGNWVIKTISGGMSYYTEHSSLALDKSGRPHIAFLGSNMLKLASLNGASWSVETVDSTSSSGRYPSLQYDSQNIPGISYYVSNTGLLRYATRPTSTWQKTDVSHGPYNQSCH